MKLSLCLVALVPFLALMVPETSANMPVIRAPAHRTPSQPHTSVHKPSAPKPSVRLPKQSVPRVPKPQTHVPVPAARPKTPVSKPKAPKKPSQPTNVGRKPTKHQKPAPANPTAPKKGGKHHKGDKTQPQNPTPKKPVRNNPSKPTQPKTQPQPNRNVAVGKDGNGIVAAASAWKGTPYSFGGGSLDGPAKASQGYGKDISGFDCSSLARYAVHKATGKTLPRTADQQWHSNQCTHVPFAQRQAGDLVFWKEGAKIGHVGIVADQDNMWHAPHHHEVVKKAKIFGDIHTKSVNMVRMGEVARCT